VRLGSVYLRPYIMASRPGACLPGGTSALSSVIAGSLSRVDLSDGFTSCRARRVICSHGRLSIARAS
jgi:hypothetical protein